MYPFDYDDIQLLPKKCVVNSRSEVDTTVKLGNRTFKLPVVPANMQSVIDEELAVFLAERDYFYVMHRFDPETRLDFVRKMQEKNLFASISLGIKESEYKLVDQLANHNLTPEYITIDIAHGHSDSVVKMIKYIKEKLAKSFVIAGNVATPEGVRDLEAAGADATKVGVGPGKACITKLKTGFGTAYWQLSAIKWCAEVATKPIIADGGIRHNGDLAKSIKFGATMIMVGSLFAGHEQSPGQVIKIDGKLYKQYWGSASDTQKGKYENVEGKQMLIDYRGDIKRTLKEIQQDLQSAVSYAGGNELSSLKDVDYVILNHGIVQN
ncbi:GMP reductase [Holzapfeliella floricola]|uniref:GMP reductase n=1 Tax=Holzapfeliella floricola DSM 23037 = JCM 16512 TaxID=1423744 RepID=A0A0R2DK53_9LACO|nr:GMP reductase [Holzapfeliella floricola]KRN04513.1 guanosine monophosphate reductase [Holzapfeliella floricola DSM 23037 = JCM 16512]